jgi:hypothetical protein
LKAQGHKQCRRTAKNEHSDNLQHGEDAPVLNLKMSEHMFKISDRERQAWLLKDTEAVSEKKRKVEEHIRILEAQWSLLVESAARRDIEAYKQR